MDEMASTHRSGGEAGLLSRREALRLAGVGALAIPLTGCLDGRGAPPPAPADPLRALGDVLRAQLGGDLGDRLPAGVTEQLTDAAAVRDVLTGRAGEVQADFGAGRTVDAQGWLLAEGEAALLIAYAGA